VLLSSENARVLIFQMNASSLLRRVNHELDVAHLPILVARQLAMETNGIGNVGEAEDDCADLKGT
jgi:hypothetical protein